MSTAALTVSGIFHDLVLTPDGTRLVYVGGDGAALFVRALDQLDAMPLTGDWRVLTDGETRPRWARNGQELFYLAPSGGVMRVGVGRGTHWSATTPTKLFDGGYGAAGYHYGRTYDVSPDGQQFLMIKNSASGNATPTLASTVVVLNWFEELQAKVPVRP